MTPAYLRYGHHDAHLGVDVHHPSHRGTLHHRSARWEECRAAGRQEGGFVLGREPGRLLGEEGRSHDALTCPGHRGLDALRNLHGSSPGGEGRVDRSDPDGDGGRREMPAGDQGVGGGHQRGGRGPGRSAPGRVAPTCRGGGRPRHAKAPGGGGR